MAGADDEGPGLALFHGRDGGLQLLVGLQRMSGVQTDVV
jgi:hypothetical protein